MKFPRRGAVLDEDGVGQCMGLDSVHGKDGCVLLQYVKEIIIYNCVFVFADSEVCFLLLSALLVQESY